MLTLRLLTTSIALLCCINTNAKEPKHPLQNTSDNSAKPSKIADKLLQQMVWIEGGSFIMGSDKKEARNRERPAHKVTLSSFYIARTEVTQELFEEVMGWNHSYYPCDKCPMNNISWFNMQQFIQRLNKTTDKQYRLPTEAEWAYAAKGGALSKGYIYSGSNNIDEVAWFAGNSNHRSQPVATKKPNELGFYDMTGNLWEFCHDDMGRKAYTQTSDINPIFSRTDNIQQKAMKVMRGSGYDFEANESEVYKRDGATNNVRMPDIGFRLAMSKK